MKYLKPSFPHKDDVIFNEKNINWDLPIYLVEGPFDSVRIPNSIPLLGKEPSELLISKLLFHNATVIIILDEDAIKDTQKIYEQLSSLGLDTLFIDMKGKDDVSTLYEKHGEQAITNLLRNHQKMEIDFYMDNLLKF